MLADEGEETEIEPFIVNEKPLTDNIPDESVKVPLNTRFDCNVTPVELLIVRLFRAVTLVGIFTFEEEPPKTRLDDDADDKLLGVPAIAGPFKVNV